MQQTVCDRCHKVIKPRGLFKKYGSQFDLAIISKLQQYGDVTTNFELCHDCMIEFRRFMNKPFKMEANSHNNYRPDSEDNVFYLCDQKACPDCQKSECKHTSDIRHAINFEKKHDSYFEKERADG